MGQWTGPSTWVMEFKWWITGLYPSVWIENWMKNWPFPMKKTCETNATKSHQSHVIKCPWKSINSPLKHMKIHRIFAGQNHLASSSSSRTWSSCFRPGQPILQVPKSWGYPQFSYIYNPHAYVTWFTGSIKKLERSWICYGFVSYVLYVFLFLRCHEISSRHGKDTTRIHTVYLYMS